MEELQRSVNLFRDAMDLPVPDSPRTLSPEEGALHVQMIRDEFENELVPALMGQDLIALYDAGIDVLVYVMGAMSNAGFDIQPGFLEVMKSNMSKLDPVTGKAIKAVENDPSGEPKGKVLKGPDYFEPRLEGIINDTHKYGAVDDTVYRAKKLPITLGDDNKVIGEADLVMDHWGNITVDGMVFDVETLPQITNLSIDGKDLDLYVEMPIEEVANMPEGTTIQQHPDIPEGWPSVQEDE